jgi:hypothetical protein
MERMVSAFYRAPLPELARAGRSFIDDIGFEVPLRLKPTTGPNNSLMAKSVVLALIPMFATTHETRIAFGFDEAAVRSLASPVALSVRTAQHKRARRAKGAGAGSFSFHMRPGNASPAACLLHNEKDWRTVPPATRQSPAPRPILRYRNALKQGQPCKVSQMAETNISVIDAIRGQQEQLKRLIAQKVWLSEASPATLSEISAQMTELKRLLDRLETDIQEQLKTGIH